MANYYRHSPAIILRQLLVDLGIGTLPVATKAAWEIHATGEPDSPDNVISVFDSAGIGGARNNRTGELLGSVGFQVRVRAATHDAGWAKADAIQRALAEDVYDAAVTVDSVSYLIHDVHQIGSVLPNGKEPDSSRRVFTLNAQAYITQL